jgi:hypothetical protein
MSCILYYSNYCEHSKKLLQSLSKTELSKDIHFICVDVREVKPDGSIYIKLQNKELILPKTITKVPALLLLNNNYEVLFGENIYEYFRPKQIQKQVQTTMNNLEPSAFSLGGGFIASDNYSFLDMDADQLSAKGNGGTRQMHSYFGLSSQEDKISTPSTDSYSNKEKNTISLEQLQKQRELEIKK